MGGKLEEVIYGPEKPGCLAIFHKAARISGKIVRQEVGISAWGQYPPGTIFDGKDFSGKDRVSDLLGLIREENPGVAIKTGYECRGLNTAQKIVLKRKKATMCPTIHDGAAVK